MERKEAVVPIEGNYMVDLEEAKKGSFLEKHKPLSKIEVAEKKADTKRAKEEYSKDISEVEKNLMDFFSLEYPMVNPKTGKVLAWTKEIPYFKMIDMIPTEMFDRKKKEPEDMLNMVKEGKADFTFKLMEEIITTPKHDWKWWKEHSTTEFIEIFNNHIQSFIEKIDKDVGFLPEQT